MIFILKMLRQEKRLKLFLQSAAYKQMQSFFIYKASLTANTLKIKITLVCDISAHKSKHTSGHLKAKAANCFCMSLEII